MKSFDGQMHCSCAVWKFDCAGNERMSLEITEMEPGSICTISIAQVIGLEKVARTIFVQVVMS